MIGGDRRLRIFLGRRMMVGCESSERDEEESESENVAAASCCCCRKEITEMGMAARWGCGGVGGWMTSFAAGTVIVPVVIDAMDGSECECAWPVVRGDEEDVRRGMDGRGEPALFEFRE